MARCYIFAIFAALTLIVSACGETFDTTYATYAEAERDGAVKKGWIPDFVPTNAHDIRDVHDLDTNRQTLMFFVRKDLVPKLVEDLSRTAQVHSGDKSFTVEDGVVTVDADNGKVVFRR